jgi:soluble lytic murein transglycosylase-like protein
VTPILQLLIDEAARAAGLEPGFVGAIVRVESGGDRYALRAEPRYRYLWDVARNRPFRQLAADEIASAAAPPDFPCLAGGRDQEWSAQRASWGLVQIMGAVAREEGFVGPYLPELCEPATNLTVGCRHLRALLQWAAWDVARAAAAYNAGKGGVASAVGQQYAAKVLAARDALVREWR